MTGRNSDYAFGAGAQEQARLRAQADAVGALSERFLRQIGLEPGMRVLDVGSGLGDVAAIVAKLVGESGEVVGVDREADLIASAVARATQRGLANVRFARADLHALPAELGSFDAAVGRLVLMHQPDAAAAIRAVAARVRPGGIVAFQENDSTAPPLSLEPLPLQFRVKEWIKSALERSGMDVQMGMRLYPAFVAAGLPAPDVRAEAIVFTPQTRYPVVALLRTLMPRMLEHGIATAQEIDVDTLEERLVAERAAAGAVYIGQLVFCAWSRVPERGSAAKSPE